MESTSLEQEILGEIEMALLRFSLINITFSGTLELAEANTTVLTSRLEMELMTPPMRVFLFLWFLGTCSADLPFYILHMALECRLHTSLG